MRWQGRRTSRNIQDRRGMSARRTGGIGGLGLIVVVLLGLFFGVDITPFLSGGVVSEAPQPTGPNEITDSQEEFVAVVLAETESVWDRIFSESGLNYSQPTLVLFEGGTTSGCGMAQSAMGPFYCPGDKNIYLDMDFFRVMEQELGSRGDFAKAYVIAHEVGHHVQDELGVLGQVNEQRSRMNEADANALSVRIELQADCYAGLWAREVTEEFALTDDDIRSALDTAARIGDDALQRAAGRRVVPDSFTHGSSEQRQGWFYTGYRSRDPNSCDTFSAGTL